MIHLALLAALLTAQAPPRRAMAVTFDDLPVAGRTVSLPARESVTTGLLRAITRHRVPAIGFVNEGKLDVPGERDAREALLAAWLDAGLELGNHTYSHGGLTATPLDLFERDVIKGEIVTRRLLARRGQVPRFFRHPMTQTGPTRDVRDAFERFLGDHGYRTAPFTIEDSDYVFALVYDQAVTTGDTALAGRVRRAYLAHQDEMVDWFESLARETFQRDIPQILLIHVNRLNAAAMGDVLGRLRARGYGFVTLDRALADVAYRTLDGYVGRNGPSWLHRWRIGLGMPDRLRDEPDPPAWVLEAFRRLQ